MGTTLSPPPLSPTLTNTEELMLSMNSIVSLATNIFVVHKALDCKATIYTEKCMVIPYCKPVAGSNQAERALFKWRVLTN